MKRCTICGGPVEVLGSLGNRIHGRCVNCGMMLSWTKKPRAKKVKPNPAPLV